MCMHVGLSAALKSSEAFPGCWTRTGAAAHPMARCELHKLHTNCIHNTPRAGDMLLQLLLANLKAQAPTGVSTERVRLKAANQRAFGECIAFVANVCSKVRLYL